MDEKLGSDVPSEPLTAPFWSVQGAFSAESVSFTLSAGFADASRSTPDTPNPTPLALGRVHER